MKVLLVFLFFAAQGFAAFDQSHSKWQEFLKKRIKKEGNQTLVNYGAVKKDYEKLKSYLLELENVSQEEFEKFEKDEKLAFWINAYNAYTLDIVARHYPVDSIKDIKSGGFLSALTGGGPWKKKFIPLFGKKLSLDNIEHDIIRKEFHEPRIHFAVNCASIGCPSLMQDAFVGARLDQQLKAATTNFLTNKNKNRVEDGKLYLSKIFDWYGGDFDQKYGGYKKFATSRMDGAKDSYPVKFLDYDWSLNDF